MSASIANIDRILTRRKVIVTVGTGGVGKTTVSAAVALRAALLGRKVVVVTIDPAKRLATSLGLTGLEDHATDLTPGLRVACAALQDTMPAELTEVKGSLAALMPDTRRTFEQFVHSLAPTPDVADRVMNNSIFQIFAKEFSGANEYMALQRLNALRDSGEYDLIVLDTPPSRNTLAFLNAPALLAKFFDEGVIKWLVTPANRIVSAGMRKALGILERLTGKGFVTDLFEFATALFEVQGPFTESLRRVTQLLKSGETGFLLVTAPSPDTAPEASHLLESLRERDFNFDGVVLNRTMGYFRITDEERKRAREAEASGQTGGAEALRALEIIEKVQAREMRVTEELMRTVGKGAAGQQLGIRLPELARDVHSMEDLIHVAMALGADQ